MVNLMKTFSQLEVVRVLLIGDFMLDTYTTGQVSRISPEAPVPVLHVQETHSLPGGAGNVALNLLALGAEVIPFGRVGGDNHGERLRFHLETHGLNTDGILSQDDYSTPIKNRIIADSQQMIRVDHEVIAPLPNHLESKFLTLIQEQIDRVDIIAISDYNKGTLSDSLLSQIITLSRKHNVPVIADPKGDDFSKYRGITMIKPNLKEAYLAAKLQKGAPLESVAEHLFAISDIDMLMVTRSEEGITLFEKDGKRTDVPPFKSREVKDVTGAGDTVLAMTTVGMANKLPIDEVLKLANVAAGVSIEHLGCAQVSLSDIAERLLDIDCENKVWRAHHLFALEQALKGKSFKLVGLPDETVSSSLFAALKTLACTTGDSKLIVYIPEEAGHEEFVAFLASLHEVDFIVVGDENLSQLVGRVRADEVYRYEDGSLKRLSSADSLLGVFSP